MASIKGFAVYGLVLCCLFGPFSSLVAADIEYDFDIPAAAADVAIKAISRQTGSPTLFQSIDVENIQLNPLEGRYTLQQALDILFDETLLSAALTETGVITVSRKKIENIERQDQTKRGFIGAVLDFFRGDPAQRIPGSEQVSEPLVPQRAIEEIIVSARKREESLQEVPVAISVIDNLSIQASGIDELGDILNNTAGMVYNERDTNRSVVQLGVRGIKSFTGVGVQRMSTFIDGMPMVGSQASIQFVDVESVEVYRGPQSAVFGRAVFVGALNYNLRRSSLDAKQGGIKGQFGEDGRQGLNGWYSAPIVENRLGFYVSASTDSYDGPGSIVSVPEGVKMGSRATDYYSAALDYQPSDALSLNLRYTHTELDDGPAPDYNLDPAQDDNIQPIPGADAAGAPIYVGSLEYLDDPLLSRNFCYNEGLPDQDCIRDPGWELKRDRLAFDADYEFENGQGLAFKLFHSEESTFDIDDQDNTAFDQSAMGVINMGIDTRIDEDYYEAIWTSPDQERLRYNLGYSNYRYTEVSEVWFRHPSSSIDGESGSGFSGGSKEIENRGVFASIFYDATDDLSLSLEARRQEDDISARDPDPTDDTVPEIITTSYLPRLAVAYSATDNLTLYAQYARGVQPATVNSDAVATLQREIAADFEGLDVGGVTLSSAIPFLDGLVAVDEEVLDNYEIGMKGNFLDGRLNLNAALFYIDVEGYQETQNIFFFQPGVAAQDVVDALILLDPVKYAAISSASARVRGALNTADLRSRGIELEAAYLVDNHWRLSGQLTYINAEFDNGCVPAGAIFGIADSTLTLSSGLEVPCTRVDGNDFPFTPELQVGLSATYTGELSTSGWEWFARAGIRYEGRQFMDWFGYGWIPSSTKADLRLGFSRDRIRVEAYVENLTDDRTPLGAQYEPDRQEVGAAFPTLRAPVGTTGVNIGVAYPREMGLKFGYRF